MNVKKVALILLELFMLVCFAFGVIRILALLGEPQIKWNAILVGVVWCFLSLFVLIKTHKKRKGVQKTETVPQFEWKTPVVNNNTHTNGYERVTQPPTMNNFVPMQSPVNPVVRNTSTPAVPVAPREKRKVHPDELNPQEVMQRYLTTDHSKVSAVFDYYSYFRAEFECMMRSIPRVYIELQNEKVLRKQELLTPFEKTAPITKHTAKQEVSNFVVIDTETTGIRTGGNDIIEVSAIKFENFVPVSMFTTLLKPRKPIPEDATRVNGITNEMVQNAPAFAQIKSALEAFVGNYPIVAHNAEFDVKFLHVSGMDFRQGAVFYDTLELSRMHIRDYDGTKLPNYKLATVCDECCIYFDGAHRSSADALATGLLFIEIVKAVFETDNVYSIRFSANQRVPDAGRRENRSAEPTTIDYSAFENSAMESPNILVSRKTKDAITPQRVPVIYPDSSMEDVPLTAKLLSTSLRCLRTSGSTIYHTHFDCFLYWPEEEKRKFKAWGAILLADAKSIGLQKCQYCESRDIPARKAYLQKTYREQVDLAWEPYRNDIPISTFEIIVANEMYIAELHRLGEEISIQYKSGKEPKIAFGLTEYCPVPQSVREICGDDYDSVKMFILRGWANQQHNLALQIGIYKRKLWSL